MPRVTSILSLTILSVACASAPPKEEPLVADPPTTELAADAAKSNPDLDRGIAFVKNGRLEEAKVHLEAGLAKDPKSAPATYYLALVNEQGLKNRGEAERLYKEALALDPKLVEASQNLAALYLDEPSRPDAAIAVLETALTHAPGEPKLLANLGFAYSLKGDGAKAEKAYRESLAKEDSSQIQLALGTLLFESKRPEEAVPHLVKAATALQEDAAALATIARMLGPGKAYEDCIRLLDRAISLKPGEAELLVRRGVCKHELKRESEASQDFEAATKADPKFQAAFYYHGLSLIALKNKVVARVQLKKAYDLGRTTPLGKQAKQKFDALN